jgi:uncharacterized protein (TIGR02145 family)
MDKAKLAALAGLSLAMSFVVSSCAEESDDDGSSVYSDRYDCVEEPVTMGEQVWAKCNLNVMHSKGNGKSWCYDNDPENCAKFGRLYDWAAAMNLPSKCNSSDCSDLIQSPHRGLCPEGWHIPSLRDWSISSYPLTEERLNKIYETFVSDVGFITTENWDIATKDTKFSSCVDRNGLSQGRCSKTLGASVRCLKD